MSSKCSLNWKHLFITCRLFSPKKRLATSLPPNLDFLSIRSWRKCRRQQVAITFLFLVTRKIENSHKITPGRQIDNIFLGERIDDHFKNYLKEKYLGNCQTRKAGVCKECSLNIIFYPFICCDNSVPVIDLPSGSPAY